MAGPWWPNFRTTVSSGSKGRDQRPGFNKLMEAIARKEFDMVAAWSVDRLSRSLRDVLTIMERLADAKAGVRSLTEAPSPLR